MSALACRLEVEAWNNLARTLARTLWLQHYLAEFLHATAQAALPVIVLKGVALAETVYPRLGLRDFRDIDILVRAEDAVRARALLESLGYQADEVHWQDLLAGQDGQADFAKATPAGAVVLELHMDLLNNDLLAGRVRCDTAGIWARARPAALAGSPARVLGPEDQLLHLCLHFAGHYFSAPRSLRDIARVCETTRIDWNLLRVIAKQSRMSRIAFIGLCLARDLFGAQAPAAVIAELAPPCAGLLTRLAAWRAQDSLGQRTALLRLPLLLLLCDRPLDFAHVPRQMLARQRRWRHDHALGLPFAGKLRHDR